MFIRFPGKMPQFAFYCHKLFCIFLKLNVVHCVSAWKFKLCFTWIVQLLTLADIDLVSCHILMLIEQMYVSHHLNSGFIWETINLLPTIQTRLESHHYSNISVFISLVGSSNLIKNKSNRVPSDIYISYLDLLKMGNGEP